MFKKILFALLLCFAIPSTALGGEDLNCTDKFFISDIKFSSSGILVLSVKFDLCKKYTLFSWQENLYPLVNNYLLVNIKSSDEKKLKVKLVDAFLPKMFHKLDVVEVQKYEYPKLLKLKVVDDLDRIFRGCATVSLIYDTMNISVPHALSKIRLQSNTIKVCNQ